MKELTAAAMDSVVDNTNMRMIKFISSTAKRIGEIIAVIAVIAFCGVLGALILT